MISEFTGRLKQEANVDMVSRLVSQCTGKELAECVNEMRVALKIFSYDNGYSYLHRK